MGTQDAPAAIPDGHETSERVPRMQRGHDGRKPTPGGRRIAAALAAVPLADAGIRYAADFSKSIVAQVSDALRTPLLRSETTTTRTTKRGTIVRRSGVSVPAWAVVAGGPPARRWVSPPPPPTRGRVAGEPPPTGPGGRPAPL